MILVLMGGPGAGKGTQSSFIKKALNLPMVSVGEILREMSTHADHVAGVLRDTMGAGKLVPPDIVNSVVSDFLKQDEYKDGCIIDGYPRSLEQAEFLTANATQKVVVVYFDTEEQILVNRLSGRFTCTTCGTIYNKYYTTLKLDGVCDNCGSTSFSRRADDDSAIIINRIKEYKKLTMPLIEYYKKLGVFYSVNAGLKPSLVELELSDILKII